MKRRRWNHLNCINKTLINRTKTSLHDKDKVFVKFYKESEDIDSKDIEKEEKLSKKSPPPAT